VELKVVTRGLQVKLRPHQISFLTRHALKGRPAFVLVKYDAADEVRLYHGRQAVELCDRRLTAAADSSVAVPEGMPWDKLSEALSQ
jgi:penicillin-binding protein-related factor A (putative recombinase)